MSIEVLGVIILAVVLAVVLYAYDRTLRELSILKKRKGEVEYESRKNALAIVKQARDKAAEIIGGAQVDASKWQEILDQEIEKLTDQELKEYKERLQSISKDIESQIRNGTAEFEKVLEMETVGAEKIVARKVDEEFSIVEKDIQAYKLKRMGEIDEEMVGVLESVSRDVVRKVLNFKDHTELIIQSLEMAKKQNGIK